MKIIFIESAWEQYVAWGEFDRKVWLKINKLIKESARTPFTGTGKPEPLRHQFAGFWSRRITEEHRLVYRWSELDLTIISCHGHYET